MASRDMSEHENDKDTPQADDLEHDHSSGFSLSEEEKHDVEHKLPPSATVLHETIRMQGETELARRTSALIWSSLTAGLSMGFSMLISGLIRAHLPDTPWRVLLDSLGYPVGFLIVILARQQLFTENTLTAVLPLMTAPSWYKLRCIARLWSVVLVGNLVGVAIFAFVVASTQQLSPAVGHALHGLGVRVMQLSTLQMFTKGITAGWLIATMVWLVPAAEHAKITVIAIITYIIGMGGFTHIIVDSAQVLYLVMEGSISMGAYVVHFALPTLAGNLIGGSVIFALMSHAQVRSDAD